MYYILDNDNPLKFQMWAANNLIRKMTKNLLLCLVAYTEIIKDILYLSEPRYW